jgi:DNA-binding CsgD family transcriptional regulator
MREVLERGRQSYQRHAWADAYQSLARADLEDALSAEDLELLATSAYLIGRPDAYVAALERAHRAHVEGGQGVRAARCAFWLGLNQLLRAEAGRARGWFARAQRLLENQPRECVEHGYLLLPRAEQQLAAGDCEGASAHAAAAVAIGERFRDMDLIACARHVQGRALMRQRQVSRGVALLDEAMVAVTAGELSPIMTGLIYCSVIDVCQQLWVFDRSREWTSALAQWCDAQPQMLAFTGVCRVHRAEILWLHGAWPNAIDEAQRAFSIGEGVNHQAAGAAFYQLAEVHRLRGDFSSAEAAYRNASHRGREPQPGLALLRLAQGSAQAAAATIRRVVDGAQDELQRTRLLPAYIEIMLVIGEIEPARSASRQLDETAQQFGTDVLAAYAAHARGEVDLAAGNAQAAFAALRRACQIWQHVDAPYLWARSRALAGLACRALGDEDGAALELQAARRMFEDLRATPDVARIDAVMQVDHRAVLTAREVQVLRLVSAGKTNKAIAAELSLSDRTVDRHLSNILTKLNVPSRAAATAYAYTHKLF